MVPVVQSVELLVDPALDSAVRDQWAALEAAGLPNAGRHTGPTNGPHVTLAVAPSVPAGREDLIAGAVSGLPLPLRLGGLVLFGGRRGEFVLARLVVASAGLLALQRAVFDALADDRLPHVRPDDWTPHITLARRLSPDQVAIALDVPGLTDELVGDGVLVRRWDSDARRAWALP